MLTDLANRTPVEIDTEIVRLHAEEAVAAAAIDRAVSSIRNIAGDRGEYSRTTGTTYRPLQESVDKLEQLIADGDYTASLATKALAAFAAGRKAYSDAAAAILPLAAEHRSRGWKRVYIVANSNGHAHRTMACPTTYAETPFNWRPDYSDQTDEQIVAAAGRLTCLVCFPDVREEILADREPVFALMSDRDQERVKNAAERQAQREAKAAKDALKGITNPDGSPLLEEDSSYSAIKSWTTAQQQLVRQLGDEAANRSTGRYARNEEFVGRLVAALVHKAETTPDVAAKIGTTPEAVMAIAEGKVKGYVKRTWGVTL